MFRHLQAERGEKGPDDQRNDHLHRRLPDRQARFDQPGQRGGALPRPHDADAVARPRFLKTGYGASGATYYDWQGYDVHKNRLYYTEGQSNYNLFGSFYSGCSFAYVTVFDFEGNIVEERTQVAVVSDKDKLTQIGVSVFGSLEAEGIKVCKDKLYLGYTARGITADNTKHYQNIFVFDPSSK